MKNLALFKAIIDDDLASVDQLIKEGANVNASDISGCSPWCCAAKANHYSILLLLTQNGAKMNDNDKEELRQKRIKEHGQPPTFNEVMNDVNAERTVADKAAKLQRHLRLHYSFMIKTPRDEFFLEEFKKDESLYRAEYERLCNERDSVTYHKNSINNKI